MYCYDPLPRTKRFIHNESIQFLVPIGKQDANLRIRCDWLDTSFKAAETQEERKYIFGGTSYRECLLLNRITP